MKRSFKQLKVDLEKVFLELQKPQYKERIAKRAIEIIYKRVKSGYGVNKNTGVIGASEKEKLSPLSESYKLQRKGKLAFYTNKKTGNVFSTNEKKWVKKPQLGKFASPDRSNLTLSGQLLESMTYRIGKDILLEIPNTMREKINASDKPITNKKLAEIIQAGSVRTINGRSVKTKPRPFFSITSGEFRILEREVDLIVKEIIKSLQL